ncbi:MAG: hypothetical protein HYT87_06570 [Nitrospirae bacterium]|nr:hypothetical protein [Nitrospirota bacterium]
MKQEPKVTVLQTVFVTNPEIPGISISDYRKMLVIMEEAFKKEWDYHIRFVDRGRLPIDAYFHTYYDPVAEQNPYKSNYFNAEEDDPADLGKAFVEIWKDEPIEEIKRSIGSYTGCGPLQSAPTKEELADQLARCHVSKYRELREVKLDNGKPLLTGAPYEQFLNWEWLARNQKEYDIVVTNQLVASIETYSPALHSSLRGGVSTGVTYRSKTELDGMVIMSSFPLLSDLKYFLRERKFSGNDPRALEMTAWYQTHELGHLIFHYDHPDGHTGCSMNFAIGFDYLTWFDQLMKYGPHCKQTHRVLKTF